MTAGRAETFRRMVNEQARFRAREGKLKQPMLLRQFYMQRLLARVFADPGAPWILKGGTSLLVRLPGARHTRDIDLLGPGPTLDHAASELIRLAAIQLPDDELTYQVERGHPGQPLAGRQLMQLTATPYAGVQPGEPFTIDLVVGAAPVGEAEYIAPQQILDIPGLAVLPKFACYPLADQVTDKLAAMYEVRNVPSTRFRDLADLLMITHEFALDAAQILDGLALQVERRELLDRFPDVIHSPGRGWPTGYPAEARRSHHLPKELHSLDAAIQALGTCVNPLLSGEVTAGTWNPVAQAWS